MHGNAVQLHRAHAIPTASHNHQPCRWTHNLMHHTFMTPPHAPPCLSQQAKVAHQGCTATCTAVCTATVLNLSCSSDCTPSRLPGAHLAPDTDPNLCLPQTLMIWLLRRVPPLDEQEAYRLGQTRTAPALCMLPRVLPHPSPLTCSSQRQQPPQLHPGMSRQPQAPGSRDGMPPRLRRGVTGETCYSGTVPVSGTACVWYL